MQLLTVTNLYPSAAQPRHGIFVEERLRHLVAAGVQAHVLALRPRAPYGARAAEASERRHGISVEYCRVPSLPKLTNWIDPWLWATAAEAPARRLLATSRGAPIVDAHFLYPDGVAGVLLARRLGVPVVMTARGSDVNVKCGNTVMRSWVRWAARHSDAVITVSAALAEALAGHRIRARRIEVLPNGVDLEQFSLRSASECRARLGLRTAPRQRIVAAVGNLVPGKGFMLAVNAVAALPDTVLVIVGDGPQRPALEARARALGIGERVIFLGLVPHGDMPDVYGAADALVLPSLREGMPNVVLESLACGTRVAATEVGGVGEVVTSAAAGVLMRSRSAEGVRDALERLLASDVSRQETRAHAERFGWRPVVERQLALYQSCLERPGDAPAHAADAPT